MSWTIQCSHRSQWERDIWEDWSGNGAFESLERALYILVGVKRSPHMGPRWRYKIVDKETGEVIPEEALGL